MLSRLIKSIIWQAYQKIKVGEEPEIVGNIRTFWYSHVKIVISKLPQSHLGKTDPYDLMTRLFTEMVLDLGLFRYADFSFTDENWENRRIGTTQPATLLFSEKRGWVRYLRRKHEQYGVSILALGGFPSALTSEYTALAIQKVLEPGQKVRLVGIVDYDPSGYQIAASFRDQLERSGLAIESLETMIDPRHYTQRELDLYVYHLSLKQKTKVEKWIQATGGVDGDPYGLESESFPLKRLDVLLDDVLSES